MGGLVGKIGLGVMTRAVLAAAMAVSLSACDTWFGSKDGPPLPGKRVSVLEHERALQPAADSGQVRLPAPEPNEDWPQAGGYAHHAMHHMEIGLQPAELWSRGAGTGTAKRNRLMGDPIVADGKVFVIDASARVTAINAETGDTLWERDLAPEYEEDDALLGGGLAFNAGHVYATTGFAQVVSLDARTGDELWRATVTAPMRASPTVNGGRVFVVTVDNKGIALAENDGRILWTHAGIEQSTAMLTGAAPAVDNGVVIMPYTSGEVAALRVDSGAPLWTDSVVAVRRTDATGNLADIGGRPVIDNNRVFVVGHSGLLVGIDLRTGNRAWELELAGISQPWVAGDYLFVLTLEGEVVGVEARTGRVSWVAQLPLWEDEEDKIGRITWAGPTLASDRLIVTGSHGEAYAISPYDGKILGVEDMPEGITLPPAVANATLYFFTDGAEVIAYR